MYPDHGLVKVHRAHGKPGGDIAAINNSSICGMAHILLVVLSSGKESEIWLVNSRIDFTTYNGIS